MKAEKGFTIAEILVVIAIVAIVGTIMVAIFTSTLRGSNKSQIFSVIKQNGQAVLEEMDRTIRGSDNVICVSSIVPNTVVVEKNGIYTRYRIARATDTIETAPISCLNASGTQSNGCIAWDNPTKQRDQNNVLETDTLFIYRICEPTSTMSSANILTDTNTSSGVAVQNGLFSRDKQIGFKDVVSIEFSLGPGIAANSAIAGQIDPVLFQTTIQLR